MKKLKLNFQNIEGVELLTREQLKAVMGGSGGTDGCNCNSADDCGEDESCGNSGCDSSNGKAGTCSPKSQGGTDG